MCAWGQNILEIPYRNLVILLIKDKRVIDDSERGLNVVVHI